MAHRYRTSLVWIAVVALLAAAGSAQRTAEVTAVPPLRDTIQLLSEPAGHFDTDNLISNERAFGRVVGRLEATGGAYIGVGPEQNFNYIARARPRWAFIVDIRRDNMLQHLLLNGILTHARSPLEYLCLLFSRALPPSESGGGHEELGLPGLVARFEGLAPSQELFEANLELFFDHIEGVIGFALSPEDRTTIRTMYLAFFRHQLALRFRTHGRPIFLHHPTYRSLLLEKTPGGGAASFLGSKDGYGHVRRLALEGRLVPVVGDLAGDHALRAVGQFLRERGETVTTFYTSNVEFYLLRDRRYRAFAENVRSLPTAETSLFLRAYFHYGRPHPSSDSQDRSTMIMQRIRSFLELYDSGAYRDYWDVCTRDYL